jgi:hypothetical protein
LALGGLFIAGGGWAFGGDALAPAEAPTDTGYDTAPDAVMALLRAFSTAHARAQLLCRQQQELETELAERVDYVGTLVTVPGGEETLVCSLEALDRLIGTRTDMATIRAKAAAHLAARQACFDAAAAEIGYFEELRAGRAAFARVEALLAALATTPAVSLAGVAGKLDAVLREGTTWDDGAAFPWPQIRAARDDLVRIGRRVTPEAAFPGG